MANIKSAAKRAEIAKVRTLRNASIKSSVKTAVRRFLESLHTANADEAKISLVKACRALDKAVTKGILHKNAAARRKSRLTRKFNDLAKQNVAS
ncbi:MAG TPA: 30S ribosomal protein S20 [Bacillota bacterium]|nr:30S ribosomal protein S20 [Bacillota bacterium]